MGLVDKLKDFANETSIHGVMFMAQTSASSGRRLLWTFLFIGSLMYAVIQMKAIVDCKFALIKQNIQIITMIVNGK